MITFTTRTNKKGMESIHAYAKNPKAVCISRRGKSALNTKLSLDFDLPKSKWDEICDKLRELSSRRKEGESVFAISDPILEKLWKVKTELEKMEATGIFDSQAAQETITNIMHAEEIAERAEALKRYEESRRMNLNDYIEDHLSRSENGIVTNINTGKPLSQNTIKGRRKFQKFFNMYQKDRRKKIDFDDVNESMMKDFINYMSHHVNSKGHKITMKQNTVCTYLRYLKFFMSEALREKKTDNRDWIDARVKVLRVNVDNVALTESHVNELYELDFTDYENIFRLVKNIKDEKCRRKVLKTLSDKRTFKAWQGAKDAFVVGCLTGQRYSDFIRLKKDMIEEINGIQFFHIEQQKTHAEVYIPVEPRVKEILERNGGEVPFFDNDVIGQRIRVMGEMLGWTEDVELKKSEGMNLVKKTMRLCDCISTHTCRRTWATNAYRRNVPLQSIMAVTGHTSEKMLRIYLKIENEEKAIKSAKDLSLFMNL